MIQEVVDRPGWASGHALALLINGSGHRTAEAVDKGGGTLSVLTISYSMGPALGS